MSIPLPRNQDRGKFMVDIARPSSVVKKKKIRRTIYATAAAVVVLLITVGVSRLKPAAPSVDRAAVWIDTVKRGPMLRLVRGSGTLVPEEIRWINTTTSGRVERIDPSAWRHGRSRHRDPRTEQPRAAAVGDRRRSSRMQSAQANYNNRKTELESTLLQQQADGGRREVPVQRRRPAARSAREAVQGRPRSRRSRSSSRGRAKRN